MREEKAEKEEVGYTAVAMLKSERCKLCKHFLPLHDKCALVKGRISPGAWCRLFKKK
jgi:hypothetical protein